MSYIYLYSVKPSVNKGIINKNEINISVRSDFFNIFVTSNVNTQNIHYFFIYEYTKPVRRLKSSIEEL